MSKITSTPVDPGLVLDHVEVIEVGVKKHAPYNGEMKTAVSGEFEASLHTPVGSRQVLVAKVKLRAEGFSVPETGGNPAFTASCAVAGVWKNRDGRDVSQSDADKFAITILEPMLYALARQHLADTVAKTGAHPDAWPWHSTMNVTSGSVSGTSAAPPAKAIAKRKAKGANR